MKTTLTIVLLVLGIFESYCYAQPGISSDGREYYIGIMKPSFLTSTNPDAAKFVSSQKVTLMVASLAHTDVSISYFESNGKENIPAIYHISPGVPKQIALDASKISSLRPGETANYNTCHVVSQAPISIQLNSTGAFSGGAYQPLPLQCLGKKYVVMSYHDNPSGFGGVLDLLNNPNSAGFFIIIAPYDNTVVQITPSSTTAGGNPGVQCGSAATHVPKPFSVSLYKGQTYMVESAGEDETCDISGTTIESSSPIIVMAGHENANTDGSQILGLKYETDWRDYMIEQLLPVECFDTAGYYTIPFQGATDPSASGGEGDEVRAFCNGASTSSVQFTTATNSVLDFSCSPFQIPGPRKINLTVPSALHSLNGVTFSVMMYDQRSQGKSGTAPAPSMTSIIPRSLWKSEYFWSIVYQPSYQKSPYYRQDSYLNIICRKEDYYNGNIKIAYGNNGITELSHSGIVVKRTWNSIPTSSDLMGLTLSLDDGNFHILNTAHNDEDGGMIPFAVYISGRGLYDPTNRPNDAPYSETVGYSYSQPLGMVYKAFGVGKPNISATITDNCDQWNICLKDSGGEGNGIRYIELLNYENNTMVPKPAIAKNVAFDQAIDPLGKGEIVLENMPMNYCFNVLRKGIPDSCRAVIAVYDNSGDRFMIDLSSAAKPIASAIGDLFQKKDSIYEFKAPHIDSQACGSLIFRNSNSTGVDIIVTGVDLPTNKAFTIKSGLPSFPFVLRKTDSIILNFCFTPADTTLQKATIQLTTSCPQQYTYTLQGRGREGLITATDLTFSDVKLQAQECKSLSIVNAGSYPFAITGYSLDNRSSFTLDINFVASMPILIQPGMSVKPEVCFHPQEYGEHTGRIEWQTNLADQTTIKSYSLLSGKSTKPASVEEKDISTTFKARSESRRLIIDIPTSSSNMKFELLDLMGRLVGHWEHSATNEKTIAISVPDIISGAYILRMQAGASVKSCTIIIQ